MAKKRSIKVVYEPKAAEPAVKVPFLVKVSISDLNIRKGNRDGLRQSAVLPGWCLYHYGSESWSGL